MTGRIAPDRPIVPGLFEGQGDAARLVGTLCRSCGARYFPEAVSCRNPACDEKAIERTLLPATGVLHSFTVQHYAPPPVFRIDGWAPYAIGAVDLDGGVQVMGMLTDVALDEIAIGMRVRVVARPLFDDGEGRVATYMFAPMHEGAA